MTEVAGFRPRQAAWTEELPHDLAPLWEGGSTLVGWLSDGSQAVAKPVAVASEEEGQRLREHLRRVARVSDPRLVAVRGAVLDGDAVWVISETDDGMSLRDLLTSGPLPASVAAALGVEVLAGLAALQGAGLSHGALHAGNVHIARDGRVRLGDYALRPRFRNDSDRVSWTDPRNDVMAAGKLLCAALGVGETPTPGDLQEAERVAPALVATARAVAAGRGGRSAAGALGTVRAAAGWPSAPAQRRRQLDHLAARVRGGEPPEAAAGPVPAPAPAVPAPSWPASVASWPLAAPTSPVAGPASGFPPAAGGQPAPVPAGASPWSYAEPDPGAAQPAPAGRPSGSRRVVWAALLLVLLLGLGGLGVGLVRGAAPRQANRSPAAAPPPVVATPAPAATPQPADAERQPTDTPQPSPSPPDQQAAPATDTPDATVSSFYQLVAQHDFGQAVQLWTQRMQANYPPAENIDQRFANTSSVDLVRDEVTASAGDRAEVSVDVIEVRDGQTYHWVGVWYLVRQSSGWLLDRPALRAG